jgi:lysophospholipase L1-like esterase
MTVPVLTLPVSPLPVLTVDPIKLMIAGDSIAAGFPISCGDGTTWGHRLALGDWLTKVGGKNVAFVGSQASTCAKPYHHHEGVGGTTIYQLADTIGAKLAANPADILNLIVGVNDAKASGGFRSAEQMAADYTRLIDNARAQNPAIRILASEVIPPNGSLNTEFARASVTARKFNLLLPQVVAPYGDAVHICRLGKMTTSLLGDGLHPSGEGYIVLAWLTFHQPDGLWPWLSADPPPATDAGVIRLDPWR